MIKSLDIRGLFGTFDYSIKMPDYGNFLIITGPNGYGKTTILSIIEDLASGNLLSLFYVPFDSIHVEYSSFSLDVTSNNGRAVENSDDAAVSERISLEYVIDNGKESISLKIDNDLISQAKRFCSWSRQATLFDDFDNFDNEFHDNFKDDEISLEKSRMLIEHIAKEQGKSVFMLHINSEINPYRFIPAQRLYSKDHAGDSLIKNSIEIVADKFSEFLRDAYFSFLQNSQLHDSQFIDMLMTGDDSINKEDYDKQLSILSQKVDVAMKYDLSAAFKLPEYIESKGVILNYYIKDTFEKFKTLEKPLRDLNLFDKLLRDKKLVNKSVLYSRRYGIRFVSESDKREIALNSLSSGEKNEILMLHDFIFNLQDGSLLMIDEPEISLHVAWQREFMNDIIKIAGQKSLRVLIATHSPQIIGGRWKDCYDLFYKTHH